MNGIESNEIIESGWGHFLPKDMHTIIHNELDSLSLNVCLRVSKLWRKIAMETILEGYYENVVNASAWIKVDVKMELPDQLKNILCRLDPWDQNSFIAQNFGCVRVVSGISEKDLKTSWKIKNIHPPYDLARTYRNYWFLYSKNLKINGIKETKKKFDFNVYKPFHIQGIRQYGFDVPNQIESVIMQFLHYSIEKKPIYQGEFFLVEDSLFKDIILAGGSDCKIQSLHYVQYYDDFPGLPAVLRINTPSTEQKPIVQERKKSYNCTIS